jgi:hypothetical protein
MKIGIITFWTSKDNYGQILQCYALNSYLKKLGQDPFLIRYKTTQMNKAGFKLKNIRKYIQSIFRYCKMFVNEEALSIRKRLFGKASSDVERGFESFISEHIPISESLYHGDEIDSNPPDADAYVCGSDQIWGGDIRYYLSFAPKQKIKIAYAPSFGGIKRFSPEYETEVKNCLSSFDFIGVRDESSVELCRRLGFNDAVKVVDPTMLLDRAEYDSLRVDTNENVRYLFLYLLGNPVNIKVRDIFKFAEHEGLSVVYVASQERYDRYKKESPTIGKWIDYIANSDFVVTNSFHCTVFSLIYQKKFATLPLAGEFKRMNIRIEELLKQSNLMKAIVRNNNLEGLYHSDFDFTTFIKYRSEEEGRSRYYLDKFLNC